MLRNADGGEGVKFSGKGVRFNVISVTRGWVGVQVPGKKRYITLEWPLSAHMIICYVLAGRFKVDGNRQIDRFCETQDGLQRREISVEVVHQNKQRYYDGKKCNFHNNILYIL